MRAAVALAALAACNFYTNPGGSNGTGSDAAVTRDGKPIDAAIDAPPDAFDPKCFGSGGFYLCLASMPTGTMTLPDPIDTSQCTTSGGTEGMVGTTAACIFAAGTINIDSTGVTGSLPLVIVAVDDINLNTSLDASSTTNPLDAGPGANFSGCSTTNGGTMNAGGGGGGAGGSFGGKGALGGTGINGGVAGGSPQAAVTGPVPVLRGGCPGGSGAQGANGPATGGPGGGAVYLVARGNLFINGILTASGGGGSGGNASKGGGGGGGSGGMIVLHAGHLIINGGAQIFANGGGGGGGAGNGTSGADGNDSTQLAAPAQGGTNQGGGSCAGGNGAYGATAATTVNGGNGGGGGGGGVGVVRVLAGGTIPASQVSPPPS